MHISLPIVAAVSQLTPEQCQHVLQTALALPTVLPPGAEATALRALSTAFQTALLGPALAQACQALHSFQTGGSSLAMAAAGLTFEQMQSVHSRQAGSPALDRRSDLDASQQASAPLTDATQSSASSAESTGSRVNNQQQQQQEEEQEEEQGGSGQLYPLEPLPDQATCCQRLLQGYSAAWLGLVPAAPASSSAGSGAGPAPAPDALLLQPVGKLDVVAFGLRENSKCSVFWDPSVLLRADPGILNQQNQQERPKHVLLCNDSSFPWSGQTQCYNSFCNMRGSRE